MCVASEIGALVPNPSMLLAFPPRKAYAQSQLFRRVNFALPKRFLQAWALAFPHLRQLLTDKCSAREAWQYSSRLLGNEPTLEAPNFTYTPPTPYPPLWVLFVPR